MEVMQLFNSLWTRMLLYALLVGGVPMFFTWLDDVREERKRKKRRRQNAKISNHEEKSAG